MHGYFGCFIGGLTVNLLLYSRSTVKDHRYKTEFYYVTLRWINNWKGLFKS